ncbi:Hypothetical protein D9617_1g085640 [Elsinoe fawcettii]|nr:Hypothetical protein D9617_1g085640 [Elsinoe fawcettii]
MFEVPRAKRVRREELRGSGSSRESSPDDGALDTFRARQLDYEIVQQYAAPDVTAQVAEEEEAEFNLFSRPAKGNASQPAKITLRSPTPDAEGRFRIARRPDTYYFTGPTPRELAEEYRSAAVSGQEVRQRSRAPWPGSRYAWKVTVIPSERHRVRGDNRQPHGKEQDISGTKRMRLGKKGRIKKRKADTAEATRKEAEKEAKEVKERAEREKKARRNREKKFKKRARDKAKKQTATGGEGPAGADGDGSGGSGSDS